MTSLLRRLEEVQREIRAYPTPIARCDLHLAALLEERAALAAQIELQKERGVCSPLSTWINDGGPHAA